MDLNPITLQQAVAVMAPELRKQLPEDREEVVGYVNRYRNLLYNLYEDVKLFDDYKVCCGIQTFIDAYGNAYQGVTIPDEMAGVVSAWQTNDPLTLRSRWRESHTGLHTGNSPHMELVEMPETSPTERKMSGATMLRMYALGEKDEGKKVVVIGTTPTGERKELVFELKFDSLVEVPIVVSRVISVVLPSLEAPVELQELDGTVLSVYYPHETIPQYRRFKINTPCSGSRAVLVQGTRRYRDIWYDTDIVEIGDRLAMESAARHFRRGEDSVDKEEIERSEFDLQKMRGYLDGIVARHRGRMQQDRSPVSRVRRGKVRSGLPGYRKI